MTSSVSCGAIALFLLKEAGRDGKDIFQEAWNESVKAISQMWIGDENNSNTGISRQRNALSMGEKR